MGFFDDLNNIKKPDASDFIKKLNEGAGFESIQTPKPGGVATDNSAKTPSQDFHQKLNNNVNTLTADDIRAQQRTKIAQKFTSPTVTKIINSQFNKPSKPKYDTGLSSAQMINPNKAVANMWIPDEHKEDIEQKDSQPEEQQTNKEQSGLMPNFETNQPGDGEVNMWGERYNDNSYTPTEKDKQGFRIDPFMGYTDNSRTNDIYERSFLSKGMSVSDIAKMRGKAQGARSVDDVAKALKSKSILANRSYVDDGTLDADHLTAGTVTGTQLKKYAQMGLTNRDLYTIDPNETYNKREEAVNYGFVPYLPTNSDAAKMVIWNAADAPNKFGNGIGKLRQIIGSTSTIDGTEVDSHEFENNAKAYLNSFYWDKNYNPTNLLEPGDGKRAHTNVWTGSDGSKHYGLVDNANSYLNDDDSLTLAFTDGSSLTMSPDEVKKRTSVDSSGKESFDFYPNGYEDISKLPTETQQYLMSQPKAASPFDSSVVYIPDMKVKDKSLSYAQAERLYRDVDEKDPDITYDHGVFGLGKPQSHIKDFISKDDDGNYHFNILEDPVQRGIDLMTGSAPIMIQKFAYPYAISSSINALTGNDPQTYNVMNGGTTPLHSKFDENGNLTLTASDVDKAMAGTFTAGIPITEQLAGPVGHGAVIDKFIIDPLLDKLEPGALKAGLQIASDLSGEGSEEIVGNLFDELRAQGLNAYGNEMKDANGNPIVDINGVVQKDPNSPFIDKVKNFMDLDNNGMDPANAFIGGATISAMFPGTYADVIRSQAAGRRRLSDADKQLRKHDLDKYRKIELPTKKREVSNNYLDQFNNRSN